MLLFAKKLARPKSPNPTCLSILGDKYSQDWSIPVLPWSLHKSDMPSRKPARRSPIRQADILRCCKRHVPREGKYTSKQTFAQILFPSLSYFILLSQMSPRAIPRIIASLTRVSVLSHLSGVRSTHRLTHGSSCLWTCTKSIISA